jgi:hypothetical protein
MLKQVSLSLVFTVLMAIIVACGGKQVEEIPDPETTEVAIISEPPTAAPARVVVTIEITKTELPPTATAESLEVTVEPEATITPTGTPTATPTATTVPE